jgi:argininosuccinate lyase
MNAPRREFPAPDYLETVLRPNFEDAQRFFLDDLISILWAHVTMLAEQKIISLRDGRRITAALQAINREAVRRVDYDGSVEDLYFYLERLLGKELSDKARVARSRNDVDMTLYRLALRRELLRLLEEQQALREAALELAARHRRTVMPAHTHTQPAQPTTLAHYLLAAAEFLERDAARLREAYAVVNRSPLGACAITTTGFPISRRRTAELLGFEGLVENSYGAIASADYLLGACAALSVAMVNLGRLLQDLLLWSTAEFAYLRIPDAYVQISSIMPQKRNPVALEHARVLASRAASEAMAVMQTIHNTPFGDVVDTEDDLQPLVFTAFGDARRAVRLLAGVLRGVEVDAARLRRLAGRNFLCVTELADVLVREAGLPFGTAHEVVQRAVRQSQDEQELLTSLRKQNLLNESTLQRALDPDHFVAIRGVAGGPAPNETLRQLKASRRRLAHDQAWIRAHSRPFAAHLR